MTSSFGLLACFSGFSRVFPVPLEVLAGSILAAYGVKFPSYSVTNMAKADPSSAAPCSRRPCPLSLVSLLVCAALFIRVELIHHRIHWGGCVRGSEAPVQRNRHAANPTQRGEQADKPPIRVSLQLKGEKQSELATF